MTAPERSLGELVQTATKDLSLLVSQEIALAKAEIKREVTAAGKGAGLFGGAGVVALYGVGALVTAAVAALDLVLPLWLAALIVAVVLFAAAGIAALLGKKEVDQAAPVVEATPVNVQRDLETIKSGKEGRHRE